MAFSGVDNSAEKPRHSPCQKRRGLHQTTGNPALSHYRPDFSDPEKITLACILKPWKCLRNYGEVGRQTPYSLILHAS
jgi:hypothetical protein